MIASLAYVFAFAAGLWCAEDAPAAFAGQVRDSDGQPVARAQVWLVFEAGPESAAISEAETDGEGRFQINDRALALDAPYPRQRYVVARDGRHRLGWASRIDPAARSNVAITLGETADYTGRVTTADGTPVRSARVKPYRLNATALREYSPDSCALPTELAGQVAATTDADGNFVLRHVPTTGSISATVVADGVGAPEVTWTLSKPIVLALPATGSLSGRIALGSDEEWHGGVKLRVSRDNDYPLTPVGEFRMSHSPVLRPVGADGTFRIDQLPAGDYYLGVTIDPDLRYYYERSGKIVVRPGESVEGIRITLKPAIWIRGRVVDAKTDDGVANVDVRSSVDIDDVLTEIERSTTTADGSFRVRARPGSVNVRISGAPAGYVTPDILSFPQQIDARDDLEWPTLRVQPAKQIEGLVVDSEGAPVAGAEVVVDGTDTLRSSLRSHGEPILTSPEGRFRVSPVAGGDSVSLWARTSSSVTEQVTMLTADEQPEPVRLVVSLEHTARIRGRVVDEAGGPVARATISLWRNHATSGGLSRSSVLETLAADESGQFESGALWPADHYQVFVEAHGRSRSESPLVEVEAGKIRELAPITLHAVAGIVEGRVLDSAGQPIAGAMVVNSGDGPKRVEVATDVNGQFRIEGLYDVPIFLCATKPTYRAGGTCAAPGATDVTITLRRPDESPTDGASSPQRRPSLAEQQQLARPLLERAWTLAPKWVGHDPAPTLIRAMARIDARRAYEWSAQDPRLDLIVRTTVAEQHLVTNVDEAISLLTDLPADKAFGYLHAWAARLATPSPQAALRLAEEALLRARALEQPHRTRGLAQAAQLLVRLGKVDAAGRIVHEVGKAVEDAGLDAFPEYDRGEIAMALACFDERRAVRIVEAAQDESAKRFLLRNVVRGVATHDPARAVELASTTDSLVRNSASVELAAHLARTSFDKAMRAAEDIPSPLYRAVAFGRIAAAFASRDRKLATDVMDRAFETLWGARNAFDTHQSFGGRAVEAALLTREAARWGYRDPQSLVYRTLALRPTLEREHSAANIVEQQVRVAMVLALSDPDTAATLLRGLEPRAGLVGQGMTGFRKSNWIQAWSLADPRRAVELCNEALEKAAADTDFDLFESGVATALELLTIAPGDRTRTVRSLIGYLGPASEED